MSARPSRNANYLEVAAGQYGVVGRDDLRRADLSTAAIWRRVQGGQLEQLRPGAFRVAGTPPSWEQDLMALQVWVGQHCRISHRSAARLWKLDAFNEVILEITTIRNLRVGDGVIIHRVPNLKLLDRTFVGPLAITTAARTLLDLGAVADIDRVEDALESALRRKLTTVGALNWEVERNRGQPGVRTLARLLADRPQNHVPMASRLETVIDRVLRVTRPLPQYVRQFVIKTRVGDRIPDFAFPQFTVAVEGDGYDNHGGRKAWVYDKQRDRALEALGWDVIHVTWEEIHERREEFVADLYRTLCRKGWNRPTQLSI